MTSRRPLLAALLSLLTTVALLPALAGPAAAAVTWYRIVNQAGSGYALSVINTANGAAARAFSRPTEGDVRQAWKKEENTDDYLLRFRNAFQPEQYMLTVQTSVNWVNKPVLVTAKGNLFPNQGWSVSHTYNTDSTFQLRNPYTNLCLGVAPVPADTTYVYAVACDVSNETQMWRFTPWS